MLEPEQAQRWRRELRAMTKAAAHDPEAFAAIVAMIRDTRPLMRSAARRLIADGFSWTDIGRALGIARQQAHKTYGPTHE